MADISQTSTKAPATSKSAEIVMKMQVTLSSRKPLRVSRRQKSQTLAAMAIE